MKASSRLGGRRAGRAFGLVGAVALLAASPSPSVDDQATAGGGLRVAEARPLETRNDAPLADAAMRGDLEAVRALVAGGADVDAAHGDGMTALHWSGHRGDAVMAAFLASAGAHVDATTRLGGYTPLHLAAKGGFHEVVAVLLGHGADARAATTTGSVRPIHFAAESGSPDAVRLLLDAGADPNARETQWEQTPLMFAAAKNRAAAIDALVAGGADVAATATVLDIVVRQAEDRADRRADDRGPEGLYADSIDDPLAGEEYTAALEESVRVRRVGETEGSLGFGELVGTHGGLTALLLAAREGHTESVLSLLRAGADIDQVGAGDGTSPLLMAVINGHYDLAMLLLERGADPDIASVANATPLYGTINVEWAPKSRHPQPTETHRQETSYLELMKALLEAGADPNVRIDRRLWYTTYGRDQLGVNRTGATPFWRAAHATDVPAMKLLVAYGADPDIGTLMMPSRRRGGEGGGEPTDPSGEPPIPAGGDAVMPIHAAAGVGYGQGYAGNAHRHAPEGWMPAVRYLVEELGADVNARDLNGYTPLHHAASRGDDEMILYLVGHGADVTAVSRRGQTVADMANGPVQRISPFPATVALLERLGSKNNHRCQSCE